MKIVFILVNFLMITNGKSESKSCYDLQDEFSKIEHICDKLEFVENLNKDQCFYDFFSEIQRSTAYCNHMTCNLDGVNYSSDSIRKLDFKNWRLKCNCN